MFSLMKKIQFKHLCWVFAFVYMSFMACNSYASICFLPTGECTDGNMDIVTAENVETWSDGENSDDEEDEVFCSSGYSKSGCTPSDVIKCSYENGKPECVKKECNTSNGWYSDCRASGKRQTCEVSNGCNKVVNVECPTGTLANCPDTGGELECKEVEEGCFETQCNTAADWYESCQEDETTTCMEGQYGCYKKGINVSEEKVCLSGTYTTKELCLSSNPNYTCIELEDGCWKTDTYVRKCDDISLFSTKQKCLDAGNSNCMQSGDCWKGFNIVTPTLCTGNTYNTQSACEAAMPGFVCEQLLNGCWAPAGDTKEKCDGITTFSTITACREKNPGKTCALDGNGCFKVKSSSTVCDPNSGFACAGLTETYNCRNANDALRDTSDSTGCNESARHMCTVNAEYDTGAEQRCQSVTCGTVSWNCVNSDGAEQTVTCLYLPWYVAGQGSAVGQSEARGWAGCRSFGFTSK